MLSDQEVLEKNILTISRINSNLKNNQISKQEADAQLSGFLNLQNMDELKRIIDYFENDNAELAEQLTSANEENINAMFNFNNKIINKCYELLDLKENSYESSAR